ncbi:MAG: type III polyketide synthase [Myxococcota bacterium]
MNLLGVGRAFPPTYAEQREILGLMRRRWGQRGASSRVADIFEHVQVRGRHLALPIEAYDTLRSFGDANEAWTHIGTGLGAAALSDALSRVGLALADLDVLLCASATGFAVPTLDARLVNQLGLRRDLVRVPLVGLGCVAGAAGIARASELVRAWPGRLAAVLCVELNSLTVQRDDTSVAAMVAAALFGDGAACALIGGPERAGPRGPRIVATRSCFYPDTERVMGWKVDERGFHVQLTGGVPRMVTEHVRADVERFLADHGVRLDRVHRWIAHPGGPKVLEALESAFALPRDALAPAWASLRSLGNLSSASVLCVLADVLAGPTPPAGAHGLLFAMGPGFCAELVLLRWEG